LNRSLCKNTDFTGKKLMFALSSLFNFDPEEYFPITKKNKYKNGTKIKYMCCLCAGKLAPEGQFRL